MEIERLLDEQHNASFDQQDRKLIYESSPEGSKFRKYMTETAVYIVRRKSTRLITGNESIALMENNDFRRRDFLDIEPDRPMVDPGKVSGCRYHVHESDAECLTKNHQYEGKARSMDISRRRTWPRKDDMTGKRLRIFRRLSKVSNIVRQLRVLGY